MIWGIRTGVWFGLALAGLALFLWCLVSMIEAGASSAGYVWGIIVFGAVALVSGAIAIIARASSGGVHTSADVLTVGRSVPPRATSGRDLAGSGLRPMGSGALPRQSSGRVIR